MPVEGMDAMPRMRLRGVFVEAGRKFRENFHRIPPPKGGG